MSDQPPHGLELLEWVKVLGGAAFSAIGATWTFLRGTKADMDANLKAVSDRVDAMHLVHADHQTKVAVIQANTDHNKERLDEIKEFVQDVNRSVKSLSEQLTDVLMEMRRKP